MNFIRNLFNKHPFIVNCATYGCLYASAEISQQIFNKKIMAKPKESFDLPSLMRFTFIGTCVNSPILHMWYKWLDTKYPGTVKKIVVKKLILDQFLFTPVLYVIFYTTLSLLERKDNIYIHVEEKFVPTFKTSCIFWIPATTINFAFINPKFRVIYVGLCSFIWVNILCWIKNSNIIEKKPLTDTVNINKKTQN